MEIPIRFKTLAKLHIQDKPNYENLEKHTQSMTQFDIVCRISLKGIKKDL